MSSFSSWGIRWDFLRTQLQNLWPFHHLDLWSWFVRTFIVAAVAADAELRASRTTVERRPFVSLFWFLCLSLPVHPSLPPGLVFGVAVWPHSEGNTFSFFFLKSVTNRRMILTFRFRSPLMVDSLCGNSTELIILFPLEDTLLAAQQVKLMNVDSCFSYQLMSCQLSSRRCKTITGL